MLTLDASFIVLLSLFVFFAGFRWGKYRRLIVAENQYHALVRKAANEQERKELEHIEAEEVRWREWMQRYEWDKEEREAKAETRRAKEEEDRLQRLREAEEGFWRLSPPQVVRQPRHKPNDAQTKTRLPSRQSGFSLPACIYLSHPKSRKKRRSVRKQSTGKPAFLKTEIRQFQPISLRCRRRGIVGVG